jgi:hypothetical protein
MKRVLATLALLAGAQWVVVSRFKRSREAFAGDRTHFIATLGGEQLQPTGAQISDAVVSVLMGGIVLDLRETEILERPAKLDLLSVMGGVMVVVPEGWKVENNVDAAMGGVQDLREVTIEDDRPTDLVLTGRLIMGGLGIGNQMPKEIANRTHETKPEPEPEASA